LHIDKIAKSGLRVALVRPILSAIASPVIGWFSLIILIICSCLLDNLIIKTPFLVELLLIK